LSSIAANPVGTATGIHLGVSLESDQRSSRRNLSKNS
jgi:hypothetical protein